MKKSFLFFILAICCAGLKAQVIPPVLVPDPNAPIIKLETDTFNFGTVKQGTRIEHDFKFTNTGKSPLIIYSHNTSCSCTDIDYPHEPIAPGKSGVLHFIFDTNGKMGGQDKTGMIESNNKYGNIVLHFKGNVILPENKIIPPTVIDPNGPVMTFENTTFDFGTIKQGTMIEHEYKFTNTGKQPLIIEDVAGTCPCTVANYSKEPIKPGGKGTILFKFDASGKMGAQDKTETVRSNNIGGEIVLHLKGNVIVPPPPIDPNAPVMTFDSLTYNFGTVIQGTQIKKDFHFTNTGKSPLIISNAVGSGSTYAEYPKAPIMPGKSGIIKVLFPTEARMGMQDKVSVITCNDSRGTIVLHIKGNVIARETPPPSHNAIMTFDSTTYHFPKTPQGKEVTLYIPFKNTGTEPLIISTCMSACGCDVAEAPKDPIAPGKTGIIKYTLNTESRMGKQAKTFTVVYNTDQVLVITIYGEIIPADAPH
jgi:hypothetical protein